MSSRIVGAKLAAGIQNHPLVRVIEGNGEPTEQPRSQPSGEARIGLSRPISVKRQRWDLEYRKGQHYLHDSC